MTALVRTRHQRRRTLAAAAAAAAIVVAATIASLSIVSRNHTPATTPASVPHTAPVKG